MGRSVGDRTRDGNIHVTIALGARGDDFLLNRFQLSLDRLGRKRGGAADGLALRPPPKNGSAGGRRHRLQGDEEGRPVANCPIRCGFAADRGSVEGEGHGDAGCVTLVGAGGGYPLDQGLDPREGRSREGIDIDHVGHGDLRCH